MAPRPPKPGNAHGEPVVVRQAHHERGLTSDEREQRIVELRARRRARMRVLALRSGIGIAALAIIAAAALYWLLTTFGGRDFLMAQIVARLPAGASLTWERAEGPAAGPLILHGVRFAMQSCPDKDGKPVAFGQCAKPTTLRFTAQRVRIDPDIRPLLGKLLRLDVLEIDDATLDIPKSDKPFELPRWPEVLPRIDLPLGLQADTIRVDGLRISHAGEPVIDVRSLRGGLDARDGKLHAQRIVIGSDRGWFTVHGDYAPHSDYATDLRIGASLPAPAGRTRPRLGAVARGDVDHMDVLVVGNAPAPLRAHLALRGEDRPQWTFSADSTALDPGLLSGSGTPGTPLSFDLKADGIGGQANLHGKLTQGDLVAVLQPSKLRIEDQVLEFKPLVVDVFGGRVTARGRGDFSKPGDGRFKFAVAARDLAFGGDAASAASVLHASGNFGIAGTTRRWAAIGKAQLRRDKQSARVDFDGRGNAGQLDFKTLQAAMPTGTLDGSGMVGWSPALRWQVDARLAGFDPGYFASGWNGAVNGRLSSTGRTRDDGGLELTVDAQRLGGNLRGRKLDGSARFTMHGAAGSAGRDDYQGEVALTVGSSRIDARGKLAGNIDVDAKFSPLQLADLLPGAAGSLHGTLQLDGARNAPDVTVDLDGSGLKYRDYAANRLGAHGRLPWRDGNGALAIAASGVRAGVALDSVQVDAHGAVTDLQLAANARGGIGALSLGASAQQRSGRWQGTLSALQLAPAKGAAWRLQAPAHYAQTGNGFSLSHSCFVATGSAGSLCASADWPRHGLTIDGNGLPLSLAAPYLPNASTGSGPAGGRDWVLRGDIAIDAQVRPAGNAFAGHVKLTSASGGLRTSQRARTDVVDYANLALDATFDAQHIQATLGAALNEKACPEPCRRGRVDADIHTGWDAYAPLSGNIAIDTDELTWMELFSPDIVDPTGKLAGHVTLAGTRAQPRIGGQATLADFATEIPSLGIAPRAGNVRLDANADGSARISGQLRSGEGTLTLDGSLGWNTDPATGKSAPLVLKLGGKNLLVSDTRDLRAVVDPDVTVRYAAGTPLEVSGSVAVPSADIDLERLDQGVSASSDVVVLDPVNPERSASTPLQLDLSLVMGDDVKLKGFGLDGTLGGQLRVRAVPGREMTAFGVLEVGGQYKAYGQELAVTRGRLQWSNGPVSDPILDIRAERKIEAEDITAGIDVSGRASSPDVQVWTDPATSQSDALSYLALGRATSSLSSDEGRQLNAASAALNAGGSLLASQIGSKIGLDDAGISDSRALGGSVFGIGKQLSPRLYVGFGVSLLGTGQVLTLKYLLRKGFDIEIESSTLENRGSINWRKER